MLCSTCDDGTALFVGRSFQGKIRLSALEKLVILQVSVIFKCVSLEVLDKDS